MLNIILFLCLLTVIAILLVWQLIQSNKRDEARKRQNAARQDARRTTTAAENPLVPRELGARTPAAPAIGEEKSRWTKVKSSKHTQCVFWTLIGCMALLTIFIVTKPVWTKELLSHGTAWLIILLAIASAALWPFHKKMGWITAIIVIGGVFYAVRTNDGKIPFSMPITIGSSSSSDDRSTSRPHIEEPLPDSFGWIKIVAPLGQTTKDGALLPPLPHSDKIPICPPGKWHDKYRLSYRPIMPDGIGDLIIVPDGNIDRSFLFKGGQNTEAVLGFQFYGRTKPVPMIAGYIRKTLPADAHPQEEEDFLRKVFQED